MPSAEWVSTLTLAPAAGSVKVPQSSQQPAEMWFKRLAANGVWQQSAGMIVFVA